MRPSRPSLLIIGHGSSVSDGAHEAAEQHALALRQSDRFGFVGVHFLANQNDCPELPQGEVFLFPFFMSDGYFVKKRIPELFSLTEGKRTEKDRTVYQCEALGVDPELADIVDTMATEVCRRSGFDTSTTHLVLVAHGSAKSSASSAATVLQQQALEKREKFGKITSVFLNESPFLEEWIEDLQDDSPSTVLIGLFAAEGPHATEDVPNVLRQLEGRGDLLHKVQYAGVVGVQPEVVKLIQHSISRCALGAI